MSNVTTNNHNSTLDTLSKMKKPALIATIALGVAYVGKVAIEAIRDTTNN